MEELTLPTYLVPALSTLIAFEYLTVFVYRQKGSPFLVHQTMEDPEARIGLLNYARGTYLLNPFYVAFQRGVKSGTYRMRDLAPEALIDVDLQNRDKISPNSDEEIGYLTERWPAAREELCIALVMPNGECAEIALSQPLAYGGFSQEHVNTVTLVIPFLEAVFRRFWRNARFAYLARAPNTNAEDAFQTFGGNRLSPRERELAHLLLRGHSSTSIGLHLGISHSTVKTHRKHLYEKLGISSQFELFSLFLDALDRGK